MSTVLNYSIQVEARKSSGQNLTSLTALYYYYILLYIIIYYYIFFDIDIDECSEVDSCSQMCTNTDGNFTCGCNIGYLLDTDGTTCNGMYREHIHSSTIYTIMVLKFFCKLRTILLIHA